MTKQIQVVINGETRDVPAGLGIASLLAHLGLRADRVAIERNLEILPRSVWEATAVQPGDRFEIVQLVGGGCGAGCARFDLLSGVPRRTDLQSVQ